MRRVIVSALLLGAFAHAVLAQGEPPKGVFTQALREVTFSVPPEFDLVTQNRRYLSAGASKAPRHQRIWQHGSEGIIVLIVVLPEARRQHGTQRQRFDLALAGMLSDPTLKVVSRRRHELYGFPAESIDCFYDIAGGTSQHVECF